MQLLELEADKLNIKDHWFVRVFFDLSFVFNSLSSTDDIEFLRSASHPVCGHCWSSGIAGSRCFGSCSAAQLCHPLCNRCSDNWILPSAAHLHQGKQLCCVWGGGNPLYRHQIHGNQTNCLCADGTVAQYRPGAKSLQCQFLVQNTSVWTSYTFPVKHSLRLFSSAKFSDFIQWSVSGEM